MSSDAGDGTGRLHYVPRNTTQQKIPQGAVEEPVNVTEELKNLYTGLVKPSERIDLDGTDKFYFPETLRDGASQGFPFMRFCAKQIEGKGKAVVYLYQPPGVGVSDGANYNTFDLGSLKGGLDFAKRALGGSANVTREDVYAAGLISKNKIASGGSGLNIRSKAALKAGIAVNPYTRQSFEGVNIRTYSFSFKLVPESEVETREARNIERTFRKFLYPKRTGQVALTYPPLFDIDFYSEGNINPNQYMPNIKPCYLTGMETTFNETANTMFKGTGAPIEIGITLSFTEERALVRQDLYPQDDAILETDNYYGGGVPSEFQSDDKPEDSSTGEPS